MIEFESIDNSIKLEDKKFHYLFSALGYETRCVFIAEQLHGNYEQGICFKFTDRNQLSFDKNKKIYEKLGFKIGIFNHEKEIRASLQKYINEYKSEDRLHIAIDISSMSRLMVANMFFSLLNDSKRDIDITILYAPSNYSRPAEDISPIMSSGPVIYEYSGWSKNIQKPVIAIFGLGYENGRALGAFDYMDASDAYLFMPVGEDKRYEDDLLKINKNLIAEVGYDKVFKYNLNNPYDTFIQLKSMVDGLKTNGRIVLVPFGPKMFNIIALLVAQIYRKEISLWRISPGQEEKAIDQVPSGKIMHMDFKYIYETDISKS